MAKNGVFSHKTYHVCAKIGCLFLIFKSSLFLLHLLPLTLESGLFQGLGCLIFSLQLLNLKDEQHPWPPPHTGTVVAHWRGKKEWPEHIKAPYLVLLDDGLAVYSMRKDSEAICATEVPPIELTFGIGGRVDCRFERDGNWFPGTITQRHDDWTSSPISTPPYFINFDYGRERPFWGPKDCIRPSETAKSSKKLNDKDLRFKIGDRVECFVEDEYTPGIVVKQWYYEADFANGHAVPYQVRLEESGDVIYAPTDADYCIRRASEPAKPLRFSVGDRVLCSREEGWVPGFVMKANYIEEDLDMLVPYKVGLQSITMIPSRRSVRRFDSAWATELIVTWRLEAGSRGRCRRRTLLIRTMTMKRCRTR